MKKESKGLAEPLRNKGSGKYRQVDEKSPAMSAAETAWRKTDAAKRLSQENIQPLLNELGFVRASLYKQSVMVERLKPNTLARILDVLATCPHYTYQEDDGSSHFGLGREYFNWRRVVISVQALCRDAVSYAKSAGRYDSARRILPAVMVFERMFSLTNMPVYELGEESVAAVEDALTDGLEEMNYIRYYCNRARPFDEVADERMQLLAATGDFDVSAVTEVK